MPSCGERGELNLAAKAIEGTERQLRAVDCSQWNAWLGWQEFINNKYENKENVNEYNEVSKLNNNWWRYKNVPFLQYYTTILQHCKYTELYIVQYVVFYGSK